MSAILSRSKNRALRICAFLKTCCPVLCSGSFGRNHEPHTGIVLGSVDTRDGELFFSASLSSAGVTRYELNVCCDRVMAGSEKRDRENLLVMTARRSRMVAAMVKTFVNLSTLYGLQTIAIVESPNWRQSRGGVGRSRCKLPCTCILYRTIPLLELPASRASGSSVSPSSDPCRSAESLTRAPTRRSRSRNQHRRVDQNTNLTRCAKAHCNLQRCLRLSLLSPAPSSFNAIGITHS